MKTKILVLSLIVLFDQFTKYLVRNFMELGERIAIIDNFLSITSHRNQGAAWGILPSQMGFFYVVTIIAIIATIYFLKTTDESELAKYALITFLAGTLGNFIDRLLFKEVTDFIDITIPIIDYEFPIFNIADSALVIAFVIIVVVAFFEKKKDYDKNE